MEEKMQQGSTIINKIIQTINRKKQPLQNETKRKIHIIKRLNKYPKNNKKEICLN